MLDVYYLPTGITPMSSDRRTFLRGLGAAAAGSIAFSSAATAKHNPAAPPEHDGFPPAGITSWGESFEIGKGEISTFSTVTPSENPKYVGVHFSDGALTNLPSKTDLSNNNDAILLADEYLSLPFNLKFPDNVPAPFKYAGLGWNVEGHPTVGAYTKPHFDIHFHFHSETEVGGISNHFIPEEKDAYKIGNGQLPDGYRVIEDGHIIRNMGGHLAPTDAPEFDETGEISDAREWEKTLLWGVADVDKDSTYDLSFIEPMVTVDYFKNHLHGVQRDTVAQPEAYPQDGYYPTSYEIRDLGNDGYAAVLTDFVYRQA